MFQNPNVSSAFANFPIPLFDTECYFFSVRHGDGDLLGLPWALSGPREEKALQEEKAFWERPLIRRTAFSIQPRPPVGLGGRLLKTQTEDLKSIWFAASQEVMIEPAERESRRAPGGKLARQIGGTRQITEARRDLATLPRESTVSREPSP